MTSEKNRTVSEMYAAPDFEQIIKNYFISVFVARQIFFWPRCLPAFSGRGTLGMNRTCAMLILQLGARSDFQRLRGPSFSLFGGGGGGWVILKKISCMRKKKIPAQDHRREKNSRTHSGLEKNSGKMFPVLTHRTFVSANC